MKKKVLRRISSTAMGALMFVCLPLSTFARVEDVSSLSTEKTIDLANETEDLILTGINTSKGSVKLITVSGTGKVVILKDLSLDTSNLNWENTGAALSVTGTGNVTFELDGVNILKSSYSHAGLEKGNDGSLTIKDDNGTSGSLDATGGEYGAGIGGGHGGDGTYITIENGTVTATGGRKGAGIGGGEGGDGTYLAVLCVIVTEFRSGSAVEQPCRRTVKLPGLIGGLDKLQGLGPARLPAAEGRLAE